MPQQQRKTPLSASLLALSVVSGSALAGVTQDVEDALNFYHYGKNGAVKFDLNTRWENVDQDRGTQKTANAVTSRLRAGLLSPVFHGIQGYAEYEGNLAMVDDYNSTRNS
jgi:hypothetical protein